jgi:hypothetical protein
VRGAPAIGAAGAMGLAASSAPAPGETDDAHWTRTRAAAARIRAARPTAVNLAWAVDRVLAAAARVRESGAGATRGRRGAPGRGHRHSRRGSGHLRAHRRARGRPARRRLRHEPSARGRLPGG